MQHVPPSFYRRVCARDHHHLTKHACNDVQRFSFSNVTNMQQASNSVPKNSSIPFHHPTRHKTSYPEETTAKK